MKTANWEKNWSPFFDNKVKFSIIQQLLNSFMTEAPII